MVSKRRIWIILICIVYGGSISSIYAEDDGLNLDTDELKDKGDNKASLTDINGLDLFVDETQIIIQEDIEKKDAAFKKEKQGLFAGKEAKKASDEKNNLFKKQVTFNNTLPEEDVGIPVEVIVWITTVAIGILVFVLTREYYGNKERERYESNIDVYK